MTFALVGSAMGGSLFFSHKADSLSILSLPAQIQAHQKSLYNQMTTGGKASKEMQDLVRAYITPTDIVENIMHEDGYLFSYRNKHGQQILLCSENGCTKTIFS